MHLDFKKIVFLDIETVPEEESFDLLSKTKQELFALKTSYQRKDEIEAEDFYHRAGIWAEFGKIVCISIGFFSDYNKDLRTFRVKSFYGTDEKEILNQFKALIDSYFKGVDWLFCAHNGKEFDFPFIARRMIINKIPLPEKLKYAGKKPWEIPHIDTMEMWKFGDYKHYTSLKLLTNILDIPTPKDDIDGSQVAEVYYKEKDIERIKTYCEKDTIAVAQLLLRFENEELLTVNDIVQVD